MSILIDVRLSAGAFRVHTAFETSAGTTAILGSSGAGKTLTLRTIAGLHRPDEGHIEVDGAALFDSPTRIDLAARHRHVGYVFQDYALFPHLTVAENIAFGIRDAGHSERDEATTRVMDMMRLTQLAGRYPAGLSGGESQRVALGRALAPRPNILLLDEPFSALDSPTREALTEEFLALRDRIEAQTLLVTHDVSEAYALSEDLVVLGDGGVLQSGPKATVFDAPSSPAAARLVGVQNIIEGIAQGPSTAIAGGLEVGTPVPLEAGQRVVVGVRASDLWIAAGATDANATLVQTIDRGTQMMARLALDGGATLIAELDRGSGADLDAKRWRVEPKTGCGWVWPGG